MNRRGLLGRVAVLLSGAALAGCSNNRDVPVTAPDGPVDVRGTPTPGPGDAASNGGSSGDGGVGGGDATTTAQRFGFPEPPRFDEGTAGNLVVVLTVQNGSDVTHQAMVRPVVEADGQTYRPTRFVELDPGEQTTLRFALPVDHDPKNLPDLRSVDVLRKTPETPIPTTTATASTTGTGTDAGESNSTGTPTD